MHEYRTEGTLNNGEKAIRILLTKARFIGILGMVHVKFEARFPSGPENGLMRVCRARPVTVLGT